MLLLVVWVVSGWRFAVLENTGGHLFCVASGRAFIMSGDDATLRGEWGMETYLQSSWELHWWPEFNRAGTRWGLAVPIWMLIIPLLAATAIAWRLDTLASRCARVGLCPKCHYDRAGLAPGAVCPECGAAAHSGPVES